LAGRRAVTTNGFDEAARTQANQYFDANYDSAEEGTGDVSFVTTSEDNGNTVIGTVAASQSTVIMRIFGFDTIPLSVSCTASMGVGNSDIMFVLDNTASMDWRPESDTNPPNIDADGDGFRDGSRIAALKTAMRNFFDTVDASVSGTNARIRYGFVPYATTVNVGKLLYDLNPNYLADSITVQSVQFVNWSTNPIKTWTSGTPTATSTSTVNNWSNVGSRYPTTPSSATCESKLPGTTAWADYGSPQYQVTYSVEADTGNQIKTTGIHQEQRRTEYRCNNRYRQQRTVKREMRSSAYEERTPVPVTDHDKSFTNAVLQERTGISVATYKTFAQTNIPVGANGWKTKFNSKATWGGCIVERQTTPAPTFSFTSLIDGIVASNGGTALDLDIDSAPTSNASTKWSPLWPEVTFARDTGKTYQEVVDGKDSGTDIVSELNAQKAESYCPHKAQLLTKMNKSDFYDYVKELETSSRGTYHDTGLLWGARMSSPTGIFASNVNDKPNNGATVSRHVIFMTDGKMQPTLDVNAMYGIERLDKRITGTGSSSSQENRHKSRAGAICEAIKARGVRLWVIAFGTSLTSDLTSCASPNSAFQSGNADDLEKTFQEIAKQVGELRITQ